LFALTFFLVISPKRKSILKYLDYPLFFLVSFFGFSDFYAIIAAPTSNNMLPYPPVLSMISELIWYVILYAKVIAIVILLFRVVLWIKKRTNQGQSSTADDSVS
jgi:hypothetical protein